MLEPILFFVAAWFLMIVGICIPVEVQKLDLVTIFKRVSQFLLFCVALMLGSMAFCFATGFVMKAIFAGVLLITLLLCWQIDKLRQGEESIFDWAMDILAQAYVYLNRW